MLWEDLTARDFETWVKKSEGVCVLPIGVLEKHGDHLPLGTDMFQVRAVAEKAALEAQVVVFPYYFLGQIAEARHCKGTIAASHRIIMDALLAMCDEIHRNGFSKILLLNGHGGNEHFLPFFAQQFPGINRNYAVYTYFIVNNIEKEINAIKASAGEDDTDYHAGFSETSLIMHLRPDLVHMDRVNVAESASLERLKGLGEKSIYTGFDWYAGYPHHFAGDPYKASAEYGKSIFDAIVASTVSVINSIKADAVSPKLIEEYNRITQ